MEQYLSPAWIKNALQPRLFDVGFGLLLLYFLWSGWMRHLFRPASTRLLGPPSESWLFGVTRKLLEADDSAIIYEQWAEKYGPVFSVPATPGTHRLILCDPKAVYHFYSQESTSFRMMTFTKIFLERLFGRGIIWAEGDSHKRQRKALSPAFTGQAIRALTPIFFDSVHKLRTAWDSMLDASPSGEAFIDVQQWMNKVSLDTIGIAGFSHDFGTLRGRQSTVADTFDAFTRLNRKNRPFSSILIILMAPVFPVLLRLPTSRFKIMDNLNRVMSQISNGLLEKMREEKQAGIVNGGKGPKSIIETLIIAENAQSELTMSASEVLAQMKTLILAGYETTSISLTWALIELSLHPGMQDTLRAELSQLNTDPTFEQLSNSFPYLDSVAKETLRLHPPVMETVRKAIRDEVIPLSTPATTAEGRSVGSIHVAKGTILIAPIRLLNTSKAIWGPDAHKFKPTRWMSSGAGIPDMAKEIHGYSHMMTFIDGPRMCLGRQFAITEFKAVLATLIRHYEFKLRDGTETEFEKVVGILPRPRIAGEEGSRVPLLVKRVE